MKSLREVSSLFCHFLFTSRAIKYDSAHTSGGKAKASVCSSLISYGPNFFSIYLSYINPVYFLINLQWPSFLQQDACLKYPFSFCAKSKLFDAEI